MNLPAVILVEKMALIHGEPYKLKLRTIGKWHQHFFRQAIITQRWPQGFCCPACQHKKSWLLQTLTSLSDVQHKQLQIENLPKKISARFSD